MKNSKGFAAIIILLVLLLIIGGAAYYFFAIKKASFVIPTPLPSPISSISPSVGPTSTPEKSTMTSIDSTWNLYTNNVFGFSIKVPKTAYEFAETCVDGKLDTGPAPVKVFDDPMGAYITYEFFYEYPVDNKCQKTVNTLSIVDQRANQWKSGNGNPLFDPGNWHIINANIQNDAELEQFVKDNYGSSCKVGDKKISSAGVYDVQVLGDGLDLEITKCPINFILALKYSPELKKAATWSVGQSSIFSSKDGSYDPEMIASFKFLK